MFGSSTSSESSDRYSNSTKWRSNNIKVAPNCPRCASSNTKFCYYNNYSLSQPRYFCKACRRYWTKGGSLRNVPVGGGCRKSRRARRSPNHMVPSPGTASADESSGGACIDIAAVFAKYVKQDLEMEESCSPGDSTGSSGNARGSSVYEIDSRLEDITTTFEHKNPLGLINVGDEEVVPEVSTCHDISSQQLVYQDSDGLELQQQVVLCDALSPDILWAECTTPLLDSGFEQLMVQGGNCELFTPDHDQLTISQSLLTDHWDYFDISAYDF